MIPAGYMAKRIAKRPDWLANSKVADIYSVSSCTSNGFGDYFQFRKPNRHGLFDSPESIQTVAAEMHADLGDTRLFYYEVYEFEFDEDDKNWKPISPEICLSTSVRVPTQKQLEGFDVVTDEGFGPDHSPLSCNSLAEEIPTNLHCLFSSFEEAKASVDSGGFEHSEPGPLRIFGVYSVDWRNG
jgi:hypothetical protein